MGSFVFLNFQSRTRDSRTCRVGRLVSRSIMSRFWFASGFGIIAPAQPSATGVPCIRPCFYSWQLRFERATRSLTTFVHSHRSLCSLAPQHSASLACSVHGLAHSLRSLPPGTVEILEYVFRLWSRYRGRKVFYISTRNTPSLVEMTRMMSDFCASNGVQIVGGNFPYFEIQIWSFSMLYENV